MNKRAAVIFLFAISLSSLAQSPLIKQWDKRYGGVGKDVFKMFEQTSDGGYILGGESESGNTGDKSDSSWGYVDYWIVRVDSQGNKLWDRRFGGDNMDNFAALAQAGNNGYLFGGTSGSQISGDKTEPKSGLTDFWVIKADLQGHKEWDKQYGGNKTESLACLKYTVDGGYILGGITSSGISGDVTVPNWDASLQTADYWIVKIDSFGNKLWDKRYGGLQTDIITSIQQTADRGYILGGSSASGIGGDKTQTNRGFRDYWVVKIDSIGVKEWDKRFGTSGNEEFVGLIQTRDQGYLLIGNSSSGINGDKSEAGRGQADYWVVKIDSIGVKEWDKTYGAAGKEEVFNVVETQDGGYLISGDSYSSAGGDKSEGNLGYEQIWLVKTDSIGTLQWDKTIQTLGHDEVGYAIQIADKSIVVAECTNGGMGGEKTESCWDTFDLIEPIADFWIVKYSDTTNYCQLDTFSLTSESVTICNGDSANICAPVGFYNYTWNNGASGRCFYTETGGEYFVTVTDATSCTAKSNTLFISILPPTPAVIMQTGDTLTISHGVSYHWYLNGNPINNANGNFYLPEQSGSYTVLVQDSNGCITMSNPVVITAIEGFQDKEIFVYPNPVGSSLIFRWKKQIDEVLIFNDLGQLVYKGVKPFGNVVNVSALTSGTYITEALIKGKTYRIKWMKL